MATIKAVLRAKENKDGKFPLAIRITKDRKTSFIHLGYALAEKDWDAAGQRVKKSHRNSARLNNLIAAKIAEVMDKSLELESKKDIVSSKEIKKKAAPADDGTFFAQAEAYLAALEKEGKYNRHKSDRPRVEIFREYVGHDLAFSDVTVGLLRDFMHHIKTERKLKERTVMNYLMVYQSVFARAVDREIIDASQSPFGKGRNKIHIKLPKSEKIGISQEDVEKLENVELAGSEDIARDIWLASFYSAGARISDVLRMRWSDFYNGRLHYTMGKNDKPGSLKITQKLFALLQKYEHARTKEDDYIFPDLKKLEDPTDRYAMEKAIDAAASKYGKILKRKVLPKAGITADMSPHTARHTFATLAGDKVHPRVLQELYRHSTLTTTINYQNNFIHSTEDDAMDVVLGE